MNSSSPESCKAENSPNIEHETVPKPDIAKERLTQRNLSPSTLELITQVVQKSPDSFVIIARAARQDDPARSAWR